MAQKVGYRQFLTDAGYKDDEIGYDPSGRVTLQGKTFAYATPEADSKTYGNPNEMGQALRSFRQNNLMSQATGTLDQINKAASAPAQQFSAPKAFTYDAQSDPSYQSAISEARRNIADEQANTNARLRASGQGKSSYSESVANQISSREMGRVADTVLPKLIDQAYAQYRDQADRDLQVQQANYGAEQDRIGNLAQSLASSSGLYNQDLANERADAAMTGQFRGENTLDQRLANLAAARQVGQDTGRVLRPTDNWGDPLYNQVEGAPLNMDAQKDQAEQERFMLTFNENVRQHGIDYALRAANQAFSQGAESQRIALARDDNARQWAALDYEMSKDANQVPKYQGINANQVLDTIRGNYLEPVYSTNADGDQQKIGDKLTSDPNRRYQMFLNVVDSGLPSDAETNQVLSLLGLSKAEVQGFTQRALKETGR